MEKGKERILTRIKGRVPCVKAGTLFFCTRPWKRPGVATKGSYHRFLYCSCFWSNIHSVIYVLTIQRYDHKKFFESHDLLE